MERGKNQVTNKRWLSLVLIWLVAWKRGATFLDQSQTKAILDYVWITLYTWLKTDWKGPKNRYTHPWHKIWRNAEECRNSEKKNVSVQKVYHTFKKYLVSITQRDGLNQFAHFREKCSCSCKLSTSCLLIFADFFSHQNLPDLFKSNTLFTSLAR